MHRLAFTLVVLAATAATAVTVAVAVDVCSVDGSYTVACSLRDTHCYTGAGVRAFDVMLDGCDFIDPPGASPVAACTTATRSVRTGDAAYQTASGVLSLPLLFGGDGNGRSAAGATVGLLVQGAQTDGLKLYFAHNGASLYGLLEEYPTNCSKKTSNYVAYDCGPTQRMSVVDTFQMLDTYRSRYDGGDYSEILSDRSWHSIVVATNATHSLLYIDTVPYGAARMDPYARQVSAAGMNVNHMLPITDIIAGKYANVSSFFYYPFMFSPQQVRDFSSAHFSCLGSD